MYKKNLNRVLGSLAASAVILSPALSAGENPFQLKALSTPSVVAEVVPFPTPKAEAPMKGMGGKGGGMMKGMMDGDKDGKVSRDEFMKHHEQMFGMMDKNKDGALDETEMGQMSDMMKNMGGGMGGMGGMNHGGAGMGGAGGMGAMDHGAGGQGGGMEGMKHGTDGATTP